MKAKKKSALKRDDIRVYDADGDLSKRWFVEWRDRDLKPVRSYKGINKHQTEAFRRDAINHLIAELVSRDPNESEFELIRNLHAWVEAIKTHVSEKTYSGYRSKLKKFESWYLGQIMNAIEANNFLDWLIEEKKLSKSYRNDFRVFMKMGYKWLIKKGIEHHNPFTLTEKLRTVSNPARPFSHTQVAHLKRIILDEDPDLWLFCELQYYCGIRPKEIRMMTASDILWEEWCFLIRKEISKNSKEQYVLIPEAFRDRVLECFYGVNPNLYLFGPKGIGSEQMIGKNDMGNRHRKILQQNRYSSAHKLYSWKHTGAKNAAIAGVKIKEIQLQLRHHSLDQTDQYLQSLGVRDMPTLATMFPKI